MINVAANQVAVIEDNPSIVNRTRLLMLTEPTELYKNPTFGVGLRRYLWQYNGENVRAMIRERIIAQLSEHEPCVIPEETKFVDGLKFTESEDRDFDSQDHNRLKMTVGLQSIFGDSLTLNIDELRKQQYADLENS